MILAIFPRLIIPTMPEDLQAVLNEQFIEAREDGEDVEPVLCIPPAKEPEMRALKNVFDLDARLYLTLQPPVSGKSDKTEFDMVSAKLEADRIHDYIFSLDPEDEQPTRVTGVVLVGSETHEAFCAHYPVLDNPSLARFEIPMIAIPHPLERKIKQNPSMRATVTRQVRVWQRGLRA